MTAAAEFAIDSPPAIQARKTTSLLIVNFQPRVPSVAMINARYFGQVQRVQAEVHQASVDPQPDQVGEEGSSVDWVFAEERNVQVLFQKKLLSTPTV